MSDWYGDEDESRRIAELERELEEARRVLDWYAEHYRSDKPPPHWVVYKRVVKAIERIDAAREGEK